MKTLVTIPAVMALVSPTRSGFYIASSNTMFATGPVVQKLFSFMSQVNISVLAAETAQENNNITPEKFMPFYDNSTFTAAVAITKLSYVIPTDGSAPSQVCMTVTSSTMPDSLDINMKISDFVGYVDYLGNPLALGTKLLINIASAI